MKITEFKTVLYQFEMERTYGDANFPEGKKDATGLVLFIETDEGLTGVSVSAGLPGVHYGARQAIHNLEPLLIGQDPRGVRGIWKQMEDVLFKTGIGGADKWAVSLIDIALWDLKAKANNEPLWKTLGASSPKVKVYASGIDMPLSDEEIKEFYEKMAELGIHAGKLKVGLDQESDIRRIGIMSDALSKSGKKPLLAIDSNEYWSPKQSIRKIKEFEKKFDLMWCEEPARRWDYRGLRKVSNSINAAVATGENLDYVRDFTPLIANEAVDIVQIGQFTCGITGAMQVAELANAFQLPVSMMNCPGSFMAHLAVALPNHMMMELFAAGGDKGFSIDLEIKDGYIFLGDSPGLGITFDEEKLAAMTIEETNTKKKSIPGRRKGAGLLVIPLK